MVAAAPIANTMIAPATWDDVIVVSPPPVIFFVRYVEKTTRRTARWPMAHRISGPAPVQVLLLRPAPELSIIHPSKADNGRSALAKSEWSFKTAVECSAALAAKKVSAVELA